MFRTLLALLATTCTTTPLLAQANGGKAAEPAPAQGQVEKLDALGLTLTLPASFGTLRRGPTNSQVPASWQGKLGASTLVILLYVMPSAEYGYEEPEDVSELGLKNFRRDGDTSFAYDKTEIVNGAFGFAPYAALGYGPIHAADGKTIEGGLYVLGGLLEKDGYALQITAKPALDAAGEKAVLEFLHKGVAYMGATRNPQWTDEEVKARWAKDAPPEIASKMEKPLRTKHYVFLSNTTAAKQMGESMEQSYAAIQKMYPFAEMPARRLMPVFLFRSSEEYHAFYAKVFKRSVAEAEQSKGVAGRDFYSTYYDAPQDPVHIHEMTHQVFANRLRLSGGGSWFQEGVAEYICTRASDRKEAANAVKSGQHTKLVDFVQVKQLMASKAMDKKSDSAAGSAYLQAALLVEFVRESKWSKDKFLDWVHAIGYCPNNSLVAIERATQAVLGVDLTGLEERWIEYCKKR